MEEKKATELSAGQPKKNHSRGFRIRLTVLCCAGALLVGGGLTGFLVLRGRSVQPDTSWMPEVLASITQPAAIVKTGDEVYTAAQQLTAQQMQSFSRQLTDLVINPSPSAVKTTVVRNTATASVSTKKPSISTLLGMKPAEIKAVNKDFYAILRVPGADIKELVVLNEDETKYFRYDFYRNYDRYGTVFADNATPAAGLGENTILYGHNRGKYSQNYKKFGTLTYFRKDNYAVKNPYIYLETLDGTYTFKIFSVFVRHAYIPASQYDRSFLRYTFASTAAKDTWIKNVKGLSMYDTGVSVSGTDKVITLVTCVYDYDDAKLVVMGKLINTAPAKE